MAPRLALLPLLLALLASSAQARSLLESEATDRLTGGYSEAKRSMDFKVSACWAGIAWPAAALAPAPPASLHCGGTPHPALSPPPPLPQWTTDSRTSLQYAGADIQHGVLATAPPNPIPAGSSSLAGGRAESNGVLTGE